MEEAGDDGTVETPAKPAYGKIKEVKLDPTLDPRLAKQGKQIFTVICSACHRYGQRYVGPALGKVVDRRKPEYIMNMILDTETMLEKDDTVRCLLQQYLTKMPNTHVNETDARAVLEHLRDVNANGAPAEPAPPKK
jgi:cytochrome c2